MMKLLILALCVSYAAAGVVSGHSSCPQTPGLGRLIEIRVTNCEVVPCRLTPDLPHLLEVEFHAHHTTHQVSLKLTTTIFGIAIVIVDVALENSAIEAGRAYSIAYEIVPNAALKGNNFSLRGELYIAGNVNEVCVNVPCFIPN